MRLGRTGRFGRVEADVPIQHPLWLLPFPGHGTSTASVIVGHGPPIEGIEGLAPEATLVPIRTTERA